MAASLSDDEFQRLQTQLIELRSKNYSLEERCCKQQNELSQALQHVDELQKELSKAQKTLSRSKKAREIEQLLQENESLQRKLQSQEDEFRLQNTTLMQELSSLVSANEKLEKELDVYVKQGSLENNSDVQSEVRHILAENAALQKSLNECREIHEAEISSLKSSLRKLVRGENSCEENEKESSEMERHSMNNCDEFKNGEQLVSVLPDVEAMDLELKQQVRELGEVRLKLNIESEEKKMLREQMLSTEKSLKEEIGTLKEETAKLSDKLKKKQESLLQLQEEKENLYIDNKKAYETLQYNKDTEIQQLKEQMQRIQTQLNNALQNQQEQKQKATTTVQILEETVATLQFQVNSQSVEALELLKSEKASLESALSETKSSLENSLRECQLLECQLETSQTLAERLQEELNQAEKYRKAAESAEAEANKLAEKRKTLLDEMAIHLQETCDRYAEEMANQKDHLQTKLEEVSKELEKEKKGRTEIQQYRSQVKTLEVHIESLESKCQNLEQQLRLTEENLDNTKAHFQSLLSQSEEQHATTLAALQEEMETTVKDLTVQIEVARVEKMEFEEEVIRLREDAKDSIEERKIQEKKGVSMVRELKRQLQVERRRAEKLQERLQELLNESTSNRSVEEILQQPLDHSDRIKGDASSISSWSFMSGGTTENSKEARESGAPSDGSSAEQASPSRATPTVLEQETNDLLARLASLQEEHWILEEKINHLEMSNAAMAEDLMKKTAIIQYYCMEGRPDPHPSVLQDRLTVKRVVDFIKDKGDENLKEINRRMQRMLEETLTKNMHLQKDLETLSNEVVRLSKNSTIQSPTEALLQSA